MSTMKESAMRKMKAKMRNFFLNSEAIESFKKCLLLMERQNNADTIQIMQL